MAGRGDVAPRKTGGHVCRLDVRHTLSLYACDTRGMLASPNTPRISDTSVDSLGPAQAPNPLLYFKEALVVSARPPPRTSIGGRTTFFDTAGEASTAQPLPQASTPNNSPSQSTPQDSHSPWGQRHSEITQDELRTAMSTNLVEPSPFDGLINREHEFDVRLANLYPVPEVCWSYPDPSNSNRPLILATSNYLDPANPKLPHSTALLQHTPPFPKEDSPQREEEQFQDANLQAHRRYSHFGAQFQYNPTELGIPTYSPSIFTASNAHVSRHHAMTVSPLDTRFNPDDSSPSSNASFSFEGSHQPADRRHTRFPSLHQHQELLERRCNSLQTSPAPHSPESTPSSAGRRRKSEYAEPGSARAIYLAKNRKAASKCRSKQKKQQEELIEMAREAERKNRTLKAEMDFLKGKLRELMGEVAQHSECSDKRLTLYVQREADRLASGGMRVSLSSPLESPSFGGDACKAESASDET